MDANAEAALVTRLVLRSVEHSPLGGMNASGMDGAGMFAASRTATDAERVFASTLGDVR